MKRFASVLAVAALAVAALWPTAAGAGGNADAAHACQKGGSAGFVAPGATMTPQPGGGFANTGDCASFAAQGGALVTPTPDVPPAPEI